MVRGRGTHTEILDVLIGQIAHGTARLLSARLLAGPPRLVDHYPISGRGRDEGEAVAELGHTTIVVHAYPRERVPEDAHEEGGMSAQTMSAEVLGWSACSLSKPALPATPAGINSNKAIVERKGQTYPVNQATVGTGGQPCDVPDQISVGDAHVHCKVEATRWILWPMGMSAGGGGAIARVFD